MAPARHIALWLATAIVAIVVGMMPFAAEAHVGHTHPHPVHATSLPIGFVEAAGSLVLKAASVGGTLVCLCPACTHGGVGCCSTGLAATADWTLPGPRSHELAASRERPMPPGIVPEALPEPPRPFA